MKVTPSLLPLFTCLFLVVLSSEAKKNRQRDENSEGPLARPLKSDRNPERQELFAGLEDPEGSAQGISQAAINPFLYQNGQAGLQNQLYQGGLQGGFGGLGGIGGFNGLQSPYAQNFNPYLTGGAGGLGGLNQFQNFGGAAGLQNQYLLQQQQQQGLQGLQGFQGSITPYADVFSQQNLYNNPYLAGNGGAGGINPLLLASARNPQYLAGGGVNPYLTQGLLSPYSNYNQINPYASYPLASRFGIGVGRTNSRGQSQTSSNTSEE